MQMVYVCVHPVFCYPVTFNAFGMTCSLLILVQDTWDKHMKEAYSRYILMAIYKAAMEVSLCLPHHAAVTAFIICSVLCACTEML